jgi:hypothetical protein
MKIKFKNALLALPLSASLLMVSCGGDPHEGDDMTHTDTTKVDSSAMETGIETGELSFQVPSPGEMLTFVRMGWRKRKQKHIFP